MLQAIPNRVHWRQAASCFRWLTCAVLIAPFACGPADSDKGSAETVTTGGTAASAGTAPDRGSSDANATNDEEQGFLTATARPAGVGGAKTTGELALGGSIAVGATTVTEDVPATVIVAGAAGSTQSSTESTNSADEAHGGVSAAGGTTSQTLAVGGTANGGTGSGGTHSGSVSTTTTASGGASVATTRASGGTGVTSAATTKGSGGTSATTTSTATAKSSPTGGASSVNGSETLADVIKRFCATDDVLRCDPNCSAIRDQEAAKYPECNDQYRALMQCQLALADRICVDRTVVVTTSRCLAETNAYKKCLKL